MLQQFLTHIQWFDLIIIGIILFYAFEGYVSGAAIAFFDFLKFIGSFLLGLNFYVLIGRYIKNFFSWPEGIARAVGFFIIVMSTEILLHILFRKFIFRFIHPTDGGWKKGDKIIGIILGGMGGILFVMILLSLFITLPLSSVFRNAMTTSSLSNLLISQTRMLQSQMYGVFGGAAEDTMKFLTVKPDSNAMVKLQFTTDGTVDDEAEHEMVNMINRERIKRDISKLTLDTSLREVARLHARDMLTRGYFSHYTPEGLSPFDRMDQAHISYQFAGENLAFSPNVEFAMEGLMNSPGHRANILDVHFRKIGVGVLDAGLYGKMFVQEFTD